MYSHFVSLPYIQYFYLRTLPNPRSWRFFPVFPSQSFLTFCVYDSYWNNFCVRCAVTGWSSFFCIWMSNCSNTTCCKGYSFFIELPLNFCQKWIFHLPVNIILPMTGPRKIRCIRKMLWIMIETIQQLLIHL